MYEVIFFGINIISCQQVNIKIPEDPNFNIIWQ